VDGLADNSNSEYSQYSMKYDKNIRVPDVILSPSNKAKVLKILQELRFREKFKEYPEQDLHAMNKFLFFGASGCGKTYLAQALANTIGYDMLCVDIAYALARGNVAMNIQEVFTLGNRGNCVIFLDEVDSIAWDRDASKAEDGDMRRALNGLFQQIDRMNPHTILVAASNMLHRLDVAFKRRFDLIMEFTKPKGNILATVRHFITPPFELADEREVLDEIEEHKLSKITSSYDAIRGMCKRAMKTAVMRGDLRLTVDGVYAEAEYTGKSEIDETGLDGREVVSVSDLEDELAKINRGR
jgi:AAA+ superfamily predicted ATPase